jgi:hypothetical protein
VASRDCSDSARHPDASIIAQVLKTSARQRLGDEIDRAGRDPYLLTVTGDDRPHCTCVPAVWDGSRLLVTAPGTWTASEALGRRYVTLLWPPATPGGYSLIVDGTADALDIDGQRMLALTPTRAVLHRRGQPSGPTAPSGTTCRSDCIPILG